MILHRISESWTELPIPADYTGHCSAGLVSYSDGREGIIVTGRYPDYRASFLDLATLEREEKAATLERDPSDAAVVPFRESFIMAGGNGEFVYYQARMTLLIFLV